MLTLNLLRSSRKNPSLSAHAAIHGLFDFNKTPLAPPGIQVLIHDKTRKTWATHALDGWYIGPALHHYRCCTCIMSTTGGTHIVDTVEFIPHKILIPVSTPDTYLHQAAIDILAILQKPTSPTPGLTYGSPTSNAFIQISQIIRRATAPYTNNTPTPVPSPRVQSTPTVPSLRVQPTSDIPSPRVQPTSAVPSPRVKTTSAVPSPRAQSTPDAPITLDKNPPKIQDSRSPPAQEPYLKVTRPRLLQPLLHHHNHFTRSRLHGFLAQNAILHAKSSPNMHIANHVFHPQTGQKLSIEKLLTGPHNVI